MVESVAENTVDAVVSPALWAVVAGAPGALGYRAVNTMDAMVGYRSDVYRRFGTASARLDDVANVVPARLTAVLVAAARPGAAGDVWRAVRRDAPAHPSPSGGVVEAAFAAALGVQLGGTSRYGDRVEDRPLLGTGRPVEPADIAAARRLARDVDLLLAALLVAKGAALVAFAPPSPRSGRGSRPERARTEPRTGRGAARERASDPGAGGARRGRGADRGRARRAGGGGAGPVGVAEPGRARRVGRRGPSPRRAGPLPGPDGGHRGARRAPRRRPGRDSC